MHKLLPHLMLSAAQRCKDLRQRLPEVSRASAGNHQPMAAQTGQLWPYSASMARSIAGSTMQTSSDILFMQLTPVLAPAVDLCKYNPPDGGKQELVAVKRLRPSILKDKTELQLFVGETKLLKKLKHRFALLD